MKTICDWKNCKEIGSYKAPVERDNSKKFRFYVWSILKYSIKIGIIFKI